MYVITAIFGDDRHEAKLMLALDNVPEHSHSGTYVRWHLPSDQSQAKPDDKEDGDRDYPPLDFERYYDATPGEVRCEVNLTSGATPYTYSATLEVDGTAQASTSGTTNTPVQLSTIFA